MIDMNYNSLVLAYLGDSVYELYVRKYLVNKNIAKVNDLQKEAIKYVSATSQELFLKQLIVNNVLTNLEIEIVKRGRNASSHKSKTTDVVTYHMSTGFECLIGYLYLNNKERLKEIMEKIL